MTELVAQGLSLTKSGRTIVDGASLTLGPGEFAALLGPNGAGKTSLLRLMLGILRPDAGECRLDGNPVHTLPPAGIARRIAYLPQQRPLAWPLSVRDVVALGRFAHGCGPERLSESDRAAVAEAIAACDLGALIERACSTLSGGELARVHLARALAARTPLLVADEPVASLDPRHQHEVLLRLRAFADRGGGVLAVLHDLDLAARYADRLIWIKEGRILADGAARDTLTGARIAEIYGVSAAVTLSQSASDVRILGIV